MILSFKDQGTEDIFDGNDSKNARKVCPINLWSVARRKLDQLNAAVSLNDLKIPSGNRLEALQSDRKGQHSIRICFQWTLQRTTGVTVLPALTSNLHFGTFNGLPTRVLYVFIGLMPTVLLSTGLATWKRRLWLTVRRMANMF